MSSFVRFAGYLAAAIFLVWRAETFMDSHYGSADVLGRIMCLILAVLLVMTGFVRALDNGNDANQPA